MGTSYKTMMVVGELAGVVSALTDLGADAWVVPAAAGRVAVLPREGEHDVADVDGLARSVSARLRTPVLSHVVVDSDAAFITVYRDGDRVHEYVSDRAALAGRYIGGGNETGVRFGGADPGVFAPFGVGSVDLDRLGVTLRGEFGTGTKVFAEFQHRLIVKAMNLDPAGLTTAFRWARQEDLPGAVRVKPAGRAPRAAAGRTSAVHPPRFRAPAHAHHVRASDGRVRADTATVRPAPRQRAIGR